MVLMWLSATCALKAQNGGAVQAGSAAPGFYTKTLEGADFFSRDYFGVPREIPKARKERQHAVLSFFATWCSPCRREIPELERLMDQHPSVKFFLVDVGESEDKIASHLKTTPIRLPILLDRYGLVAKKYGVMDGQTDTAVLPTLVIVDQSGVIRYFKKGYTDGDEKKIEEEILKLP